MARGRRPGRHCRPRSPRERSCRELLPSLGLDPRELTIHNFLDLAGRRLDVFQLSKGSSPCRDGPVAGFLAQLIRHRLLEEDSQRQPFLGRVGLRRPEQLVWKFDGCLHNGMLPIFMGLWVGPSAHPVESSSVLDRAVRRAVIAGWRQPQSSEYGRALFKSDARPKQRDGPQQGPRRLTRRSRRKPGATDRHRADAGRGPPSETGGRR